MHVLLQRSQVTACCARAHPAFRSSPYFMRCYSAGSTKASVKLIAEIRKAVPGTSLVKARQALESTDNNLCAALEWLEKDIAVSGAAKAAKLDGRTTNEGLIALAVLSGGGWRTGGESVGVRAAMVELNCETDFVARNELFVKLAEDISHTAALLTEPRPAGALIQSTPSPEELGDAPLVSTLGSALGSVSASVSESIRNSIARLGEKISLRRVCTVITDPLTDPNYGLLVSSYVHGGAARSGRVGALVSLGLHSSELPRVVAQTATLHDDVTSLGRALAAQVAGYNPETIRGPEGVMKAVGNSDSTSLYDQPVMMRPDAGDRSVGEYLKGWARMRGLRSNDDTGDGAGNRGVEVVQFERWSVGD